jgi:hypothetical protein
VFAADTFQITALIGNDNTTQQHLEFSNINEMLDIANTNGFNDIFGSKYKNDSPIKITLNFRGVEATQSYAENSKTLVFEVPSLGIWKSFTSDDGTRDNSEEKFMDYLTSNEDNLYSRMLGEAVRITTTDPVAGNPNSLMDTMATNDFDLALGSRPEERTSNSKDSTDKKDSSNKPNAFVGFEYVYNKDTKIMTIPLSYTHYFSNPDYYVTTSSPISHIDTNGSKSYRGSSGAALHIPITDNWSLTPMLRAGGVASIDMGSASAIGSASVGSTYKTNIKGVDVKIANMVSAMKANPIELDGKKIGYDLSNNIIKNGVSVKLPQKLELMGNDMQIETSLADTKITGSEVAVDHYNDVAVSIGDDSNHQLGVTYTKGNKDYQNVKLNFGYSFW